MQFSLGLFIFEQSTLSPQSMTHSAQSRWANQSGIGKNVRPSYQAVGIGQETITMQGVTYPECFTDAEASLNGLWWMKDAQHGWYLVRGDGSVFGVYIIEGIEVTYSHLNQDGSPKKIEFSLNLSRVDDVSSNLLGSLKEALLTGLF